MAHERVQEDTVIKTAAGSYNASAYEPKPGGREIQDLHLPTLPNWAKNLADGTGGVCNFVKPTEA